MIGFAIFFVGFFFLFADGMGAISMNRALPPIMCGGFLVVGLIGVAVQRMIKNRDSRGETSAFSLNMQIKQDEKRR